MNYPTTIKNLIECYKKLPGIGEKTAERLALATLEINQETLDVFAIFVKYLTRSLYVDINLSLFICLTY